MKLVVFDLDGTLTATNAVDDECFVQALRIAFNIDLINTNWTEYSHVTDSGVMAAAFREKFGRDAEPSEASRFIECFVSLLTEAHSTNRNSFSEIPGAAALVAGLHKHSQWRPAIATGGWERSARFKMAAAGIDANGIAAAFSGDGPAREMIVEGAIRKACVKYRVSEFEKIVLVGDAIWDAQTAGRLTLPFVGIGNGEEAALLRNAGAIAVIANFLDHEYCLECFEGAATPNQSASRQR